MKKDRNPEYDRRDALFREACGTCSRTSRCSFPGSLEGPEAVCRQLIQLGTYNCESCVRRNKNGGCTFACVFRIKKDSLVADVVAVASISG